MACPPVAVIRLGWLLVLGLDVVYLRHNHRLEAAGAALEGGDGACDLALDAVAAGHGRVLDGLQLVGGLSHNLF